MNRILIATSPLRHRFPRLVLGLGLGLALLTLLGCPGATAPDEATVKAEAAALFAEYLPKLGQAYATRDPELVRQYAVPKELSRMERRMGELAEQGQVYEPTFQSVTIESLSVWNYANAFVTTVEVWDVRSFSIGSHTLLNEQIGQRSRVKYQLKREDDGTWRVLLRELSASLN